MSSLLGERSRLGGMRLPCGNYSSGDEINMSLCPSPSARRRKRGEGYKRDFPKWEPRRRCKMSILCNEFVTYSRAITPSNRRWGGVYRDGKMDPPGLVTIHITCALQSKLPPVFAWGDPRVSLEEVAKKRDILIPDGTTDLLYVAMVALQQALGCRDPQLL
jgi:hypothetical protein